MLVVSDTSPVLNLAIIGQLDLLHQQFGKVWLPQAVTDEWISCAILPIFGLAPRSIPNFYRLQEKSEDIHPTLCPISPSASTTPVLSRAEA